jgi:hypothetical protein
LLDILPETKQKASRNEFVDIQLYLRQPRALAGATEGAASALLMDSSTGALKVQTAKQARRVTDFRTWVEAYANVLAGKASYARTLPKDEADLFMERELSFFQKATLQFGVYTDSHVIQWVEAHRTAVHRSGGNIAVLTSMHELRNTPRRSDAAAAAATTKTMAAKPSSSNSSSSKDDVSKRARSRSAGRDRSTSSNTSSSSSSSSNARAKPNRDETCDDYNSKKGCKRTNCWYKHVCSVRSCGLEHPVGRHT